MIRLDRSKVKPPRNWRATVARKIKAYATFVAAAAEFEKLEINDPRRLQGFASRPGNGLPVRKGRSEFPSVWGVAKPALARMSHDKCAYCEGEINSARAGQVEHFKPKSRFPSLAYDWGNYFFACGGCNGSKGDKWPATGEYLRPDSIEPSDHLEFQAAARSRR